MNEAEVFFTVLYSVVALAILVMFASDYVKWLKRRLTKRAADEPQACDNFKKARDGKCYNCGCEEAAHR